MASAYRDARSFFAGLTDMAEELRLALIPLSDIERAELVTEIVRDSDMVFGVWPDDDVPDGFGVQIIKGEAVMPPLEAFETNDKLSIAAIPCVGLEQALAARDELGNVEEPEEDTPEAQIATRSALALAEARGLCGQRRGMTAEEQQLGLPGESVDADVCWNDLATAAGYA